QPCARPSRSVELGGRCRAWAFAPATVFLASDTSQVRVTSLGSFLEFDRRLWMPGRLTRRAAACGATRPPGPPPPPGRSRRSPVRRRGRDPPSGGVHAAASARPPPRARRSLHPRHPRVHVARPRQRGTRSEADTRRTGTWPAPALRASRKTTGQGRSSGREARPARPPRDATEALVPDSSSRSPFSYSISWIVSVG